MLIQLTVNVLRILQQTRYADRLVWYFETLAEYHARPKDVYTFLRRLDSRLPGEKSL
jgi:hypothetical protein